MLLPSMMKAPEAPSGTHGIHTVHEGEGAEEEEDERRPDKRGRNEVFGAGGVRGGGSPLEEGRRKGDEDGSAASSAVGRTLRSHVNNLNQQMMEAAHEALN